MVQQHHRPEYPRELRRVVDVLLVLEQADEHVLQPVVVDLLVADELLEHEDDALGREFAEAALHKLGELLLCFRREVLRRGVIVGHVDVLELSGVQVIDVLLDPGIYFFPEVLVGVVELLHQIIEVHNVDFFDPGELVSDLIEPLHHPLMLVPVVLLLSLNLT